MADVSAHGDEEETKEAERIIEMERLMEEEGAKCFVVMASDTDTADPADPAMTRNMAETMSIRPLAQMPANDKPHSKSKATSSTDANPSTSQSCLKEDGTSDYADSDAWAQYYKVISSPDDDKEWPQGLSVEHEKMFLNGKLLVPESRAKDLLDEWHQELMHPSAAREWKDMEPRFLFPHGARELLNKVQSHCQVCAACNPANYSLAGDQQWTPIPVRPMESVSMDVFSMPEVKVGKDTCDCVVIVVDRHLGYLVAIPAKKKGLTANEVAEKMIKHWLTIFDISATICGDNAPQFTGGWFKAIRAYMGVRHATSVAHLSGSNGGAELAGRQVFERLRKLHLENPKKNWFRETWRATEAYHDLPAPSGLSPHQIFFTRDRLSRSLPWYTTGPGKHAVEAFKEAEDIAKLVKDALAKEHAKRQDKTPKGPITSFKFGGHVWVERPRPLGTHRTRTWYTPRNIAKRVGPSTFLVQTGPSQFKTRHKTQMQDRVPHITGKHVDFQYTKHEDDSDEDEYLEEDDYVVDKVFSHRPNPAVPGGMEFKVKWKGYGKSHDWWVPPSSFVPRIQVQVQVAKDRARYAFDASRDSLQDDRTLGLTRVPTRFQRAAVALVGTLVHHR